MPYEKQQQKEKNMLTMKVTRRNGFTSIEEILHANIDHATSCLSYLPIKGTTLRTLHPNDISQAFIMNDAGKTVMSHNFVNAPPKG